jgi:two-component system chemotaxis response regulator CheY
MKLLIVDDSNVIRRAIARSLESRRCDVRTAGDGEEALAVFEEFSPDAITMDITMPKLDGLACIRAMISRNPETRILVISALADKQTAMEAVELGAQGFLLKPFTPNRLVTEIECLLED